MAGRRWSDDESEIQRNIIPTNRYSRLGSQLNLTAHNHFFVAIRDTRHRGRVLLELVHSGPVMITRLCRLGKGLDDEKTGSLCDLMYGAYGSFNNGTSGVTGAPLLQKKDGLCSKNGR